MCHKNYDLFLPLTNAFVNSYLWSDLKNFLYSYTDWVWVLEEGMACTSYSLWERYVKTKGQC